MWIERGSEGGNVPGMAWRDVMMPFLPGLLEGAYRSWEHFLSRTSSLVRLRFLGTGKQLLGVRRISPQDLSEAQC